MFCLSTYCLLFLMLIIWQVTFAAKTKKEKIQNKIKNNKIKLLKKYTNNDTINLDGVTYYAINNLTGKHVASKVKEYEKDFRKLIAMRGVKYEYKRKMQWRTWRRLNSSGNDQVISYLCHNPVPHNSTGCKNYGLWKIEEKPPCPYELFSMIDEYTLCGTDFTKPTMRNIHDACPATIRSLDLTSFCDNPIETYWQITRQYNETKHNHRHRRYRNLICANKDYCEVFSTYTLMPKQVVFRFMNSTNDVFFARVMRANYTNYFCTENCGRYDPVTKGIVKVDL